MDNISIYYFTGTGNSLAIAKEFALDTNLICNLKAITPLSKNDKIACDTPIAGFIFPLYFTGIPNIVLEFVEMIDLSQVKYIFTVVNKGMSFGCAIDEMKKLLKMKNTRLNLGIKLNMPNNYITITPSKNTHKTTIKQFSKMKHTIHKISGYILSYKNYIQNDYPLLKDISKWRSQRIMKNIHSYDKHFYSDLSCNGCGLCEKVCPVHNIEVQNNPIWKHNCQLCFSCINYCPQIAIQYTNATKHNIRYYHPDIKASEIISARKIHT